MSRLITLATTFEATISVEEFVSAPAARRLELLEPYFDVPEETRREHIESLVAFVNALERFYHSDIRRTPSWVFEDLAAARQYLRQTSPAVKFIGEHLALTLPKQKLETKALF